MSKDLYALVRANTVRVKIDDQCDILVTVSDSMAERDHPTWGGTFFSSGLLALTYGVHAPLNGRLATTSNTKNHHACHRRVPLTEV